MESTERHSATLHATAADMKGAMEAGRDEFHMPEKEAQRMTRDAAYRRAVAVDRIAELMRSHADQSDPSAYRDACAAYLAQATEYRDALRAPAVRLIVDAIAAAAAAFREASLALSSLVAPPEAFGHLRERLFVAAEAAEAVSGALSGWPEFRVVDDDDDDPDPEDDDA